MSPRASSAFELLDGDVLDALLGLGHELADRFLGREHGESSVSGIPSPPHRIKRRACAAASRTTRSCIR